MNYSIDQAIDIAKNFTAPRKKSIREAPRPALRGAYIDHDYVWATDSVWMVRIKHNENVQSPRIHGFTPEDAVYFSSDGAMYPDCKAILPNLKLHSCSLRIEKLYEWINVHEQICLMKHNQFHTTLDTEERTVKAKSMEKGVFGNSMAFIYRDLPFEEFGSPTKLYYDASKMLEILKIIQKLRVPDFTMYIFGATKPFVIEVEDILFLILPFADEYKPVPEKVKKPPKSKKEPKPKPEPKPKKETKKKTKPKGKTKNQSSKRIKGKV